MTWKKIEKQWAQLTEQFKVQWARAMSDPNQRGAGATASTDGASPPNDVRARAMNANGQKLVPPLSARNVERARKATPKSTDST